MNLFRTRARLLALLLCLTAVSADPVHASPPASGLKFTAKPLTEEVELGDVVEIELTFKNVSDQPLSLNLRSAARCSSNYSCPAQGGDGGYTSMPEGREIERDLWQRIVPGDCFRMVVVHKTIASRCIAKIEIQLRFHSDPGPQPPSDRYEGLCISEPFYIDVSDNALLRELKTENPNAEAVRSKLLELFHGYKEDSYRSGDLFNEMERRQGASLVVHLAAIAADESLDEGARSYAASHLGTAVYYSADEEKPGLREIALPLLKRLVADDSALIRRRAIWGLCCADRTQSHLERFDALVKDPDEEVRYAAADYLKWFMNDTKTRPYVLKALQDSSPKVRWAITTAHTLMYPRTRADMELLLECCLVANDADTLRLLQGPRRAVSDSDLPVLLKLLETKPPQVQVEVVKLAGKTVSTLAADFFEKALKSEHPETRTVARETIERSGDSSSIPVLEEFAESCSESELAETQRILSTLRGEVPFPDVKKLMEELLPAKRNAPPVRDLLQRFQTERYPQDAIAWLFLADDPKEIELFRPLLDSNSDILRAIVCRYMGRISDQGSYEKIASLTQDPSPLVRCHAAEALGDLGRAEGLFCLLRLRRDSDMLVRDAVGHALRKTFGGEATRKLVKLFERDDATERWSMQEPSFKALLNQRPRSVIPLLIQLTDPPEDFSHSSSVPPALKELSGHWVEGDYDDPTERKRLVKEWRVWWENVGRKLDSSPGTQPEATYCDYTLMIETPRQDETTGELIVSYSLERGGGIAPLTIPVTDEALDGHFQAVLFQDGQEVERVDISRSRLWPGLSRYDMIPYGPIAEIRVSGGQFRLKPTAPPGEYEIQVEARYLCAEKASWNFPNSTFAAGAHLTAAEVFTLKSNRCVLSFHAPGESNQELPHGVLDKLARMAADPHIGQQTITLAEHAPQEGPSQEPEARTIVVDDSAEALEYLKKEGRRALPFVLKYFDPKTANYLQIRYLQAIHDPRAQQAIDAAFLAGNSYVCSALAMLRRSRDPEVKKRLLEIATAEVGSENWDRRLSRAALEALDGKIGPEDREFVAALSRELFLRLVSARDAYSIRGGESLWGAFRTAFFLGQIGDKGAVGVLRRATHAGDPDVHLGKNLCIFLRWYAAAALKLIEVQNRPEEEQQRLVERWLRHCFSSREEHFMSRSRLIPHLSDMLGEHREDFFNGLLPALRDPWMIHDARVLATVESCVRTKD